MTDEELTGRFNSIDQRFERLAAFIKEEGTTTRRHFDVVGEAIKAEVKLIAGGHGALQETTAVLNIRMDRVEARQDRVEDRQLALEHRQEKLEKR